MSLEVKVIPKAKRNFVKEAADGLRVYVTAPVTNGKANKAVIDILAEHFGVAKGRIEIVRGLKSRHKVIKINEVRTYGTNVT